FFFESSKGVGGAGNGFVDNAQGIRVLNSSNARVYHNTFYNSPGLFDRHGPRATRALLARPPATGPGGGERGGPACQRNPLVAGEGVDGPLLEFRQAPALCGRMTRPMATRVDGNVYVRGASDEPLVGWGPVRGGTDCQAGYADLDAFRRATKLEANGVAITSGHGSPFRSIELRRFDLAHVPEGVHPAPVPEEAAQVLGWSGDALPGAYPAAAE